MILLQPTYFQSHHKKTQHRVTQKIMLRKKLLLSCCYRTRGVWAFSFLPDAILKYELVSFALKSHRHLCTLAFGSRTPWVQHNWKGGVVQFYLGGHRVDRLLWLFMSSSQMKDLVLSFFNRILMFLLRHMDSGSACGSCCSVLHPFLMEIESDNLANCFISCWSFWLKYGCSLFSKGKSSCIIYYDLTTGHWSLYHNPFEIQEAYL